MIEIRITPTTPEMMAKVIALLTDVNNMVTMAEPAKRQASKLEQEPAAAAAEEANQETPPEPAAVLPEVTLEMVRARLADLSNSGKSAAVKTLLATYGATRLTEVAPRDYADLLGQSEHLD